jgi:hypothetical protein
MTEIIPPVSRKLLKKELTSERFLRETNYSGNQIYTFTAHEAPNLMKEVGRTREITFREAGGGTGNEVDIDHYDTADRPYHQLIVWDPKEEEILGGYRYFICGEMDCNDKDIEKYLATSHLFNFSEKFKKEYMPYTIELGRSFVQPMYQSSRLMRKGMFALDNLWDGLGALCLVYQEAKYFLGKVTMYTHYDRKGRDMILGFMHKYFPDYEGLVTPKEALFSTSDLDYVKPLLTGQSYEEDYKILSKEIRDLGLKIPPLINSYMNLSSTMKTFGTSINDEFGDVEETGILITIKDIYDKKISRHVVSYIRDNLRIKPLHLRHIRVRFPHWFTEGIHQARKKKNDEKGENS